MSEALTLQSLIAVHGSRGRTVETPDHCLQLADFTGSTSLACELGALADRSVLLHVRDMATAAAALIELDGLARRLVLAPPGWDAEALASAARDAEADAFVHDSDVIPAIKLNLCVPATLPLRPCGERPSAPRETEWVLPTSGTSGAPKLVVHTLRSLTGAIIPAPPQQWATFYDIRRYGGLQIFLRALSGRGSLFVNGAGESQDAFLIRLGSKGVTHVSGTPTHWRKALMGGEAGRIAPDYVRLSGEIADDSVLQSLRAAYPKAKVEHAYASTEAGVGFTVNDGRAGFPASLLERDGPVRVKVVDDALHIASERRALRFLGSAGARPLADDEGFVDTGDMVERQGDRYLFVGRRGGIINVGGAKVHPETVEAAINAHASVRASRAFARKNPITGALVVADVVLRDDVEPGREIEREILAACRASLPAYMAPTRLQFVPDLPMTDGGKLARNG